MGSQVVVDNLAKVFPDGSRALDGIDLAIRPGELVALVGSNGSGKSTLLRCLVRLLEPTSGRICIDDVDVTATPRRRLRTIRSRVGFVFQQFHLVPRISAFHNVLLGALYRSGLRGWSPATATRADRELALDCLDRVGLGHLSHRRSEALSGGERQRVAIARMLMQRPDVVLADEPVASLDPAAAESVMALLGEVARERGLTVVVALHQLDHARAFADRVVGLRHGTVALDAPVSAWDDERILRLYAARP